MIAGQHLNPKDMRRRLRNRLLGYGGERKRSNVLSIHYILRIIYSVAYLSYPYAVCIWRKLFPSTRGEKLLS